MSIRLIPILLSLWLFAGLQGLGVHVHEHAHGVAEPEHVHVVSAFDDDHARAHASGDIDEPSHKITARAHAQLALGPISLPSGLTLESRLPIFVGFSDGSILPTGPPPHTRPPSQAPPESFAIA